MSRVRSAPELSSFEGVYRRLNRPIFYFFTRRGLAAEDSRDLVQETFVRALRRLDASDEIDNLDAWVFGIAKNVWLENLRSVEKSQRQDSIQPDYAHAVDRDMDPADLLGTLIDEEQRRLLISALDDLPPRMRACTKLWIRGLAYKQIAVILDTSIGTVKSQIFDAKKKLRATLLNRGNAILVATETTDERR